jgi:competence protein ComEA
MEGMQRLAAIALALVGAAGFWWLGSRRPASPPAALAAPPAGQIAFAQRAAPSEVVVYVAGAVARPGIYRLPAGRRVDDALRAAGAAKPDADLIAVNLAAPLHDGEEIAVPQRGVPLRSLGAGRAAPAALDRRGGRRGGRVRKPAPPAEPLDLNHADVPALAALPGVGRGLAERIVAFREANGPFASVDELADVAGVTDRRLEALLPYLVVR